MYMDFIIENVTAREIELLEENNVDFYMYDIDSDDIVIESEEELEKAIRVMGR